MKDRRRSDPYAAPARRVRHEGAAMPITRLRRLGATPDQLARLVASWEAMDEDQRRQFADAMAVMADPDLVAIIRGGG